MSAAIDYPFIPVPKTAVLAIRDTRAYHLYGALLMWSDWKTGEIRYPVKEVAARLGVSLRTVQSALQVLRGLGYVGFEGDAWRSRWWVIPPNEVTMGGHDRPQDSARVVQNVARGVQDSAGGSQDSAVDPVVPEHHRAGFCTDLVQDSAPSQDSAQVSNPHQHAPESLSVGSVPRSSFRSIHDHDLLTKREIQDQSKPTGTEEDRSSQAGDDLQDREDPKIIPSPAQLALTGEPEQAPRSKHSPAALRLDALWGQLWGRDTLKATKAREDRLRIMRKALKDYGEERAVELLTGHAKDPWFSEKKVSHPEIAFRPKHEDKFLANAAAFAAGAPIPGSDERGGGRGGDRAYGGSEEVLMGQAALDKVAAETRARRERDRKQAEEGSTPEALAARDAAIAEWEARKARKAGGR